MFSIPLSLRSKRAKLALRFFTYGVMTLATVVLTTLAIFYAMGYRFNQATLTFEQGGLVQLRSTPEGATVVVDGKVQNFKTPGRVNLPAGVHTVVMQLAGYREWQRTVPLAPGQLLWLNYTRFIPNSVTTKPLKTFPGISATKASPDRRWMLVQEKADLPLFTLVDFNDEHTPAYTDFSLPDTQLSKVNDKYGQFTIAEWDLSSRYFLVHHTNGTVNEWLRVDRAKPDATVNLTRQFGFTIDDAHFAGTNPNLIYVKTGDVLRRIDAGANNATASLVNGVQQFSVFGDDTVSFSASRQATPGDANSTQVLVGIYKQDKETDVQSFPAGTALKTAFSEFDNHSYLALEKGDGRVHILRDPGVNKDTAEFASFVMGSPVQWLIFSNGGRMVTAGVNGTLQTYDLDIGKTYPFTLSFLGADNARHMEWLDDYYLWSDVGGQLRIVEFDGQNDREITTLSSGFTVSLSQSGQTLYSIGKNSVDNSYFLQASQLTTP